MSFLVILRPAREQMPFEPTAWQQVIASTLDFSGIRLRSATMAR